jgi:hypothetical protein
VRGNHRWGADFRAQAHQAADERVEVGRRGAVRQQVAADPALVALELVEGRRQHPGVDAGQGVAVRGQVRTRGLEPGPEALEVVVGAQVVRHDVVAADPRRPQQHRHDDPGAVLASGAVDEHGATRRGDDPHDPGQLGRRLQDDEPVGPREVPLGGRRCGDPLRVQGLAERDVVHVRHRGERVHGHVDLLGGAQVDHG